MNFKHDKKTAVVSVTENGRRLSAEIAGMIGAKRYCFHKNTDDDAEKFFDIKELARDIFAGYDAVIFVCACGIAVRAISPYIVSKQTDPAVIVIDDCGKYVIPILSGHIGGANALARRIAGMLGAAAIITTATDIGGKFSPDSFAAANDLIITDMHSAKEIAAAVLANEKTGFACDYRYYNLPDGLSTDKTCRIGICVTADINKRPFEKTLVLVPRNIVVGIGCRKNTPEYAIENAVKYAFEEHGISAERICAAATIDTKSAEAGLLGFCAKRRIPLCTYPARELMELNGDFSASEFVKSITGADNVCERSAVKCSGGKLIFRKTVLDGVTVSAAEKEVAVDLEREIL